MNFNYSEYNTTFKIDKNIIYIINNMENYSIIIDDYTFYIISKNVPNKYFQYVNKGYKESRNILKKLNDDNTTLTKEYTILYEEFKSKSNIESEVESKSKLNSELLIRSKEIKAIRTRIAEINKTQFNLLNEHRFKLFFKSKNNITNEINELYAYTSISEIFCWRICFIGSGGSLSKFDNYIQATILDFRLQSFIWEVFPSLPYVNEQNIQYEKLGYISYEEYSKLYRQDDIPYDLPYEKHEQFYKNKEAEFNKIIIKEKQNDIKNPNGIIGCNIYTKKDYYIISDRGREIINDINELQEKYEIINIKNKINYLQFMTPYNDYYIENDIFGIELKNKETNEIIIAQIGDCKLIINEDNIFNGMYILNIIPQNVKINSYGLYETYYYDYMSNFLEDYKTINRIITTDVISKPIDYKRQVRGYDETADFNDKDYVFIAHYNKDKFIIKELIQEKERKNKEYSTMFSNKYIKYKNKYIKYKNKYIKLKNELNNNIA